MTTEVELLTPKMYYGEQKKMGDKIIVDSHIAKRWLRANPPEAKIITLETASEKLKKVSKKSKK
jgi:hypothetical protein